jgi:selenocysteine-specific translation elongation factor
MKHLAVGVFHDDAIGRELGRKETGSDIVMFNRKMDEHIFTFMSPLDDKLSAKSQIISSIDAAVVTFAEMTRELGETVVLLDSPGISKGIAVTSLYATPDQITAITKDTSLSSLGNEIRARCFRFSKPLISKEIRPHRFWSWWTIPSVSKE